MKKSRLYSILENYLKYTCSISCICIVIISNSSSIASARDLERANTVENTAHVAYVLQGQAHNVPSNTVITSLVPLIDVSTTAIEAVADTMPGNQAGHTYSFVVSNPGTAKDQYELGAAFTSQTSPVDSLWLDVNHNHLFDAGIDTRLDPTSVRLEAGESVTVMVLAKARGTMRLTATSLNDNLSAVVRHRQAGASVGFDIKRGEDKLTLTKSQTVDTKGANAPGPGSLITYSLDVHIPANAGISDGTINDAIPAGTRYVNGTLSLDDGAISDATDADSGAFDPLSQTIAVRLPGDVANSSTASNHVVRFQVRIN